MPFRLPAAVMRNFNSITSDPTGEQSSAPSDLRESVEISVVVPVYNSAGTIAELAQRLGRTLADLVPSSEIIFVDDGSQDASFLALQAAARANPQIRVVKMLRNFGQHPAITAGLRHTVGQWVVLMDDDLQTPPEEIPKLYRKAREGFDIVSGIRADRRDSAGRRAGSYLAHMLMRGFFRDQPEDATSSFRIISRRAVDAYLALPETHTYVAALFSWMGFPQTGVEVAHAASALGRSRYSYRKLVNIWLEMVVGFSDRPLRIAIWLGLLSSGLATVLGIRTLILYLFTETPVPGYASLFVTETFFFGIVLLVLGIMGEYIARIYREVKGRPYYIVDYSNSIRVDPFSSRRSSLP